MFLVLLGHHISVHMATGPTLLGLPGSAQKSGFRAEARAAAREQRRGAEALPVGRPQAFRFARRMRALMLSIVMDVSIPAPSSR